MTPVWGCKRHDRREGDSDQYVVLSSQMITRIDHNDDQPIDQRWDRDDRPIDR